MQNKKEEVRLYFLALIRNSTKDSKNKKWKMQRGKKEMKYEMKKVERNFWFVTPEGITEDSRILNEKI